MNPPNAEATEVRKPVIGVMGGSKADEPTKRLAHQLGRAIAERGWILLNGGRNSGVMAASAAGAREAGGTVIGILPDTTPTKAAPDLDIAILTGIGDGRNLINVLSSDVVIACPGSLGTLSEVVLALKHDKRVILLGHDMGADFDKYKKRGRLTLADTPADAITQARQALS